jgi:hypothetical protein
VNYRAFIGTCERREDTVGQSPLTLEAWSGGERVNLRALDRDRIVCTTAEATFDS